jgi:hypothetical protein
VDLNETGISVSLKVPIPETTSQLAADANDLIIARFFPMTIRWRAVEMPLVIKGSGAPAPRADSALLKAVARALAQPQARVPFFPDVVGLACSPPAQQFRGRVRH